MNSIEFPPTKRICAKCGSKIYQEVSLNSRMVKGVRQSKQAPTGWFLCGCGFATTGSTSKRGE